MVEQRPTNFLGLIRVLKRNDVDFILVGGVAAIVEGAPITTLDLDIVFDRNAENIGRLAAALSEVNARYRDFGGREIVPDTGRLTDSIFNLLLTDFGPLDVLGEIGDGEDYRALMQHSSAKVVGDFEVVVLGLEKIIETKKFANSAKDRAVLPVLQKTLEMKKHGV